MDYDPGRPAAAIAEVAAWWRSGAAACVLLEGADAGERAFAAQRLADELGLELAPLDVPALLKRAPRKAAALWTAAAGCKRLPLLDGAGALLAKGGEPRPEERRAGQNAARVLRGLARRRRPLLLAVDATAAGARLAGLRARCDGRLRMSGFAPRPGGPAAHAAQGFRVAVDGVELACSHVGPIVSEDAPAPAGDGAQRPALRGLVLRRAVGADDRLFAWRRAAAEGRAEPREVLVHLLDRPGGEPVVAWRLCAARPVRWSGPTLDALAARVAEEEIELRFQRVEWLTPAGANPPSKKE